MNSIIQKMLCRSISINQHYLSTNRRLYSRWAHRKPARVILPFESNSLKQEKIITLDSVELRKSRETHASNLKKDKTFENETVKSIVTPKFPEEKTLKIKKQREIQIKNRNLCLSNQKVFDENNEIIYEKLKDNDGRISNLLINLKSKKNRARAGQVLVEGWRLILDGIEAKCPLKYVIFSNSDDLNKLKPFLPKTGLVLYKIPYKEIELWSNVETSPGLIGIFDTPTIENIRPLSKSFPIQIVCDNIRVPGNLGAILRAAVGVGCEKVYLMKGCVDYWDPKVVRSAAGAHFRLPVHHSIDWEQLPDLISQETSIFIADNNSKVVSSFEHDGAILHGQAHSKHFNIPLLPYYGVEYGSLKSIALIIGGETEGISVDSYRFAAERNGHRVNIDLENGVDSLNSGMAAAVIAFEIKKKILQSRAMLSNAKEEIVKAV